MTREEAIAKGLKLNETQHSMKRRSPWHNYHQKGLYMVTLVINGRKPLLGTLTGNVNSKKGREDYPSIRLSSLGRAISEGEIIKIHHFYPRVEVWKVCFMPDHIHMILRVKEDLPTGKTLGSVIKGFKTGCTRSWWKLEGMRYKPSGKALGTMAGQGTTSTAGQGTTSTAGQGTTGTHKQEPVGTVPVSSAFPEDHQLPLLFEPGYNDKILYHEGQLENWKHYLDDNPRRLLIKRKNPQFFTILHSLTVAGRTCQAVGNRFLLDIPDKVAVIVHRRYTDAENARLRDEWLACGERGGVLVSAAISQKEKMVLREAMNMGYRIILLRENGFPDLYKPSGESFEACSRGTLLQISPWAYHMERKVISRAQCLALNELAEHIVNKL